mmetsp:Transcript_23757/g.34647  ORF Transcript_23757/g.34647 Transcript_23757/m.34647 type:complete len:161 (-) Transcript_23757:316-798(-)|eukprot:CAMPEP_0195527816 /NCGR_PEP_ID=MMETSP0794_2-20130614/29741_1 /TAXON_ID=515487 /ORGANISM="Stephanopyxis turris, Strain CCMP 815" /LENGTH=160 /DNA_ID=CAMNT_0040658817 /DNA_START=121 /DNA_END=603 /DNA_ORIENTATION=+
MKRIVVPQRAVNGGFDFKFETDAYNVRLYNVLSAEDYTDAIAKLNEQLKPSRSTKADTALLVTGPLIIPLAAWGVRHGIQMKKRKKLLQKAIQNFNTEHPALLMRWNRRPVSALTIEGKTKENTLAAPLPKAAPIAGAEPAIAYIPNVEMGGVAKEGSFV